MKYDLIIRCELFKNGYASNEIYRIKSNVLPEEVLSQARNIATNFYQCRTSVERQVFEQKVYEFVMLVANVLAEDDNQNNISSFGSARRDLVISPAYNNGGSNNLEVVEFTLYKMRDDVLSISNGNLVYPSQKQLERLNTIVKGGVRVETVWFNDNYKKLNVYGSENGSRNYYKVRKDGTLKDKDDQYEVEYFLFHQTVSEVLAWDKFVIDQDVILIENALYLIEGENYVLSDFESCGLNVNGEKLYVFSPYDEDEGLPDLHLTQTEVRDSTVLK